MEWIDAVKHSHPQIAGWYLVIYQFDDGTVAPVPLYYKFTWVTPKGFFGIIRYYSLIENTPIELTPGGFF